MAHRALAILLVLGAIVSTSRGRAETPRLVMVLSQVDDPAPWSAAVASHLNGLGVTLVTERAARFEPREAKPEDGAALARSFVDVAPDAVTVVLFAGERGLLRRLETAGRSEAVLREEVALVIATAVESLLAGAPLAAPRAEVLSDLGLPESTEPTPPEPSGAGSSGEPTAAPPKAAPPPLPIGPDPRAPSSEPPGWRLFGTLFYEAQGYAERRVMVHGPGMSLSIQAPSLVFSPGVELFGQYRLPYEEQSEEAGFSLDSGIFRLMATGELFTVDPVTMRIGAGAGIDVLHIAPFAVAGETEALPARTRVAPAVRLGLALSVLLIGDVALEVGASGDLDVIGTRYVIQRGDTLEPLLEPLRFRPALSIGLSTTLAGAPRASMEEGP